MIDYMRMYERMRGKKEGCGEGDWGEWKVMVGRVVDGGIVYERVNEWIRFVG